MEMTVHIPSLIIGSLLGLLGIPTIIAIIGASMRRKDR